MLRIRICRESLRGVHVSQNADQIRILSDNSDDGLRLDRPIFKRVNNFLLDLIRSSSARTNLTRIGYSNISGSIDGLIGQIYEITRTNTRFTRNKEAACRSFKDCNAEDVVNPESNAFGRPTIPKHRPKPWRVGRQDALDLRCNLHHRIGETSWVFLTREYSFARGAGNRHPRAATRSRTGA